MKKTFKMFLSLSFIGILLFCGMRVVSVVEGRSIGSGNISNFVEDPLVDIPRLNSKNAILVCLDDQRILIDKESDERIYPASLTKLMTALLLAEHCNMKDTVLVPQDIFPQIYSSHASVAGFQYGDIVTTEDLLYGILLPSGADASLTAAKWIGGSEKDFVAMMNQKADSLGMKNTHFTNATGLHDRNHFSTANDLMVLLNAALQAPAFYKAFCTKEYVASNGVVCQSTLFSLIKKPFDTIQGGKTGYTKEAGLCLASTANIHGKNYLLVTANAEGNNETAPNHIIDAENIYNFIENIL